METQHAAGDVSAIDGLALDVPSMDVPARDVLAIDSPVIDVLTRDVPALDVLAIDSPVIDGPAIDGPAIDDPAIDPPVIKAVVHAGATETHYRRAGRGAAVLLLFCGGAASPAASLLFGRLARRFRVIAPVPPAGLGDQAASAADGSPASVAGWLRDLIDGLGVVRPGIVAGPPFGAAALGFARTDPERVGAVVAVSGVAVVVGASVPRLDSFAVEPDEVARLLETETETETETAAR